MRRLWDDYAESVYPHDDLVVSLRGRRILDVLEQVLTADPETVLVVCGAGFSSYPWLLPFPAAVEVDLPRIIEAKRSRATELVETGVLAPRAVTHLAADLAEAASRERVVAQVRTIAAGRPVVYVAEGLVFYLPDADARAVTGLGGSIGAGVSVVSYWPLGTADNRVLAAQRAWFRSRSVSDAATYLSVQDVSEAVASKADNESTEDLQRRYLGEVTVPETELVPEHVAVCGL